VFDGPCEVFGRQTALGTGSVAGGRGVRISWEPNGVDVSGSLAELAEVARQVKNAAVTAALAAELPADATGSAAPYVRYLNSVRIIAGRGPVCITEHPGGILNITGGPKELGALASFFVFEADATPGAHSHYEYFPGNEYVAPESLPLVVSLETPGK
jgi:hypothetical protein